MEQFLTKYNGQPVDFDKAYGVQCVDLFNYYNQDVVQAPRIGTPVTNGARDLYEVPSTARDAHYQKLPANTQLQRGDVLVYGQPHGYGIVNGVGRYFGHVAIYLGNGQLFQANANGKRYAHIAPLFTNGLLGVLRPNKFLPPAPKPAPQPAPQPQAPAFAVGDRVVPTRLVSYEGVSLKQWHPAYTIIELRGDRAVLAVGNSVFAALRTSDIRKA